MSDALELISNKKRRSGCHIVFSGFDTHNDHNFEDLLLSVAARGNTYAVLLLDKMEQTAPPGGYYRYRSNGTRSIILNKDKIRKLNTLLSKQIASRRNRLLDAGIKTLSLPTNKGITDFLATLQQQQWV